VQPSSLDWFEEVLITTWILDIWIYNYVLRKLATCHCHAIRLRSKLQQLILALLDDDMAS